MTETTAPQNPQNPKPAAHPAVPAPTTAARRRLELRPEPTGTKTVHWILLAAVVVVAIGVRVKEPTSSALIGAEDPYRHMERTWDLVQGKGFSEYPPGLNLVLLPFTFLGPDAFYMVSMYIPLAFAAVMVIGMFYLGRAYLHPSGALVGSALVAVMPEMVRRTDLLFPTALDLALLPFLFLAILRVSEGNKKALVPTGVLGAFLLLTHPWVFALLIPPVAVFGLIVAYRDHPQWRKAVVGASIALGVIALGVAVAFTNLLKFLSNPGQLGTLPAYVDLPAMLTLPAIILGVVGAIIAVRSRDRFSLLALLWTGMLLPLVLADWLDMWYVPHRTVAYMGLGIAMLGAVPIAELLRLLKETRPQSQPIVTFGAVGLALLVMTPTGYSVEPWYRTFTQAELDAWHEVAADNPSFVMAASWESRAGYRAVTGREANYNPGFFNDEFSRQLEERDHPGLVVLVDCHAESEGNTVASVEAAGYHLAKEWGDRSCPKEPTTGLPYGWTALYTKG